MTGVDLGGDGGETRVEGLDLGPPERGLEPAHEPAAIDEARAGQAHIEIAEHAAARQRPRPGGEVLDLAGGKTGADHRAHRGAGDDVGLEPMRHEGLQDPDMGKAARRPAAECDPDRWPPRGRRGRLGIGLDRAVPIASTAQQSLQHGTFSPNGRR